MKKELNLRKTKKTIQYIKSLRTWDIMAVSRIDLFLMAAFLMVCMLTMHYADITVTSQFGVTFIESIYDGKILSFYQNCLNTGIAPEGAVYDMGIYAIFGMWSIPIWLIGRFFTINMVGVAVQLWYKLLIVIFMLAGSAKLTNISYKVGISENVIPYINIIYLLSGTLWMPVLVASQYDVLPLFFLLAGFEAYLENDKTKFFIYFSIATTMKPFAVLLFVALVVLNEKSALKIFRDLFVGILPVFVLKIAYSFTPGYATSSGSFLDTNLNHLLGSQIEFGICTVSLFVILIVAIYCWAYCQKKDDFNAVLISYAVWLVFIVFAEATCYWSVYLTPFIILGIFMSHYDINKLLLFDLIFEICISIIFILKFSWVYGGDNTFSYLMLSRLFINKMPKDGGVTVAGILRQLSFDRFLPAISAIVVTMAIVILLIGIKRTNCYEKDDEKSISQINVWHIRSRYLLVLVWFMLCLGAFVLGIMGY